MPITLTKTELYSKLIEALNSLEQAGIIYNAGSGYTESDAINDLSEKFSKFTPEARKQVWGYCLYHEQDAARALKEKFLMLSFGALDDQPATIKKVAETVSAALSKHGFSVTWNGSINHRVQINSYT